jgi:benzoate transport
MHTDPRELLNQSEMTRFQYVVVALTVALNALDGFDVLAISFASPGIAAEWGTTRAALGFILSAELWGMALGSVALGGVSDSVGRKPTILGCLFVMVIGMFMVTLTTNLYVLCAWRVLTGIGIGGMLASINAQAAEFSNNRNRATVIAIMSAGYPIGGVVGGLVVSRLLEFYDWRSVFYFGSAATALMIPMVVFLMPESVHWLVRKKPANGLNRINAILTTLGHRLVELMPEVRAEDKGKAWVDLFSKRYVMITVLMAASYFLHIATFYFILKWVPDIVVRMGFPASSAGDVVTMASVGGLLGCMAFAFLGRSIDLRRLTIGVFVLSWIATIAFGYVPANLVVISLAVLCAGFFINAGIVGMYTLAAQMFPTHLRASGTGFTVGVGRGGSMLSPIIAGFLFQAEMALPTVALLMATGSILAAGALFFLKTDDGKPQEGRNTRGREAPLKAATGSPSA